MTVEKSAVELDARQEAFLRTCLRDLLDGADETVLTAWRSRLYATHLRAGQTLMHQGEPGDSMYLLLSGRLRAYVGGDSGEQIEIGEMSRGEVIGEISMFTDQPRSATVKAIRDSTLARLDKADFPSLLVSSANASIAITRQIIARLQSRGQPRPQARPVTIGLMPVSDAVDAPDLAQRLAQALRPFGTVAVVCRPASDEELDLDAVEAAHDFVLLVTSQEPDEWTQRCARQSDELLLLADATQPAALHPNEWRTGSPGEATTGAPEVLVLLHPADRRSPRNSREWIDRRPVADHLHIRPDLPRDLARLARIVSRNAVGLVLAGGGARGAAHLGVWRALQEQGVDVDYVGGTSIGSIMAVLVAADQPLEDMRAIASHAMQNNPTGDFNPLPLLSLAKGTRANRTMAEAVDRLFGFEAHVDDLWRNAYCVSTNYTQASEYVARRGRLDRALLASISIPGVLPPVLKDGEILCDGGTINNFPVDVMRRMRGVRRVIGVDLSADEPVKMDLEDVPSPWALALDRLRPEASRRYRLPSLIGYLINVMLLHSTSRQREARLSVDLCFTPPLGDVGLLDWKKLSYIEEQGYRSALTVLQGLGDEVLKTWQGTDTGGHHS